MRNRKLMSAIFATLLSISSLSGQPVFAADVSTATTYELDIQMSCSGISKASVYCEIDPSASNEEGTLEGTIKVAVCIYLDANYDDKGCYGDKAISTGGKGPSKTAPESVLYFDLPLEQTSTIKLKNYTYGKKMYQEINVQDSKLLAINFDAWESNGKKDLAVSLTTPNMVLLGETASYKITTSPKTTGTCTLYRSQYGANVKVGSAVLRNGTATGKLRWLWTTAGQSVPMTLKASCDSSQYAGEKIVLVNGIRK